MASVTLTLTLPLTLARLLLSSQSISQQLSRAPTLGRRGTRRRGGAPSRRRASGGGGGGGGVSGVGPFGGGGGGALLQCFGRAPLPGRQVATRGALLGLSKLKLRFV